MMPLSIQTVFVFLLLFGAGPLTGQAIDARIGSGKTAEQDPVLSPGGDQLFFTRPGHKNNQGRDDAPDVWLRTRRADGGWNRAINPGPPINSYAADRLLGFNPDGTRIAVLRDGKERYVDILQRDGRSWRKLARTQVPQSVGKSSDIAYNLVTGELVYAIGKGTGKADLYLLSPAADGSWAAPRPVAGANTNANEERPFFAADGRTLYFFRSSTGWFQQVDRGEEALLTRVPILSQRFAVGLDAAQRAAPAVVGLAGGGLNAELRGMLISERDQPRPGRVVTPTAPAAEYALTSGVVLQPRSLTETTLLFLRDGERLVNGEELSDLGQVGKPVGGIQSQDVGITAGADAASKLEYDIMRYENYLATLEEERERVVELVRWQEGERTTNLTVGNLDTLPPTQTARGSDPHAEDLDELEAMKAKFRRQQNRRRGDNDRGEVTFRPRGDNQEVTYPSIADSYTPPPPPRNRRLAREQYRRDSLDRSSQIRNGLSTPTPSATPDRGWEHELSRGLPDGTTDRPDATSALSRIDEEYQRQYAELERLRSELSRLRNQGTMDSPSPGQSTQAKSPYATGDYTTPVPPQSYGDQPAAQPPTYDATDRASAGSPAARAGSTSPYVATDSRQPALATDAITFIPNTAYPDGAGYGGLEQLLDYVRRAKGTVEVRIHTSIDLPRRTAQLLSEERATSVRDYLVEQGIAERHFTVVGYGNNLTGKGGERVEVF